jgi:hypothetical protein
VFQVLIDYAYTWEMWDISPDIVVEVFLATDRFMIEGLRHGCEAYLCTCITKETALELFQIAGINYLPDLLFSRFTKIAFPSRRML